MIWGVIVGNVMLGRGVISGEILVFLDRLEIFGEVIFLNDEIISLWNFNVVVD